MLARSLVDRLPYGVLVLDSDEFGRGFSVFPPSRVCILTDNATSQRGFRIAARAMMWVACAFSLLALNVAPANASMIFQCEASPENDLIHGLVNLSLPFNGMSGSLCMEFTCFDTPVACRPSSSSCGSVPKKPVPETPMPIETHIALDANAASSSMSGSSSAGSSITGGESVPIAMTCSGFEPPIPLLVSWLSVEQSLDVPPAPPFELLRPPQIFTLFA